jgi:hypothetical protein
VAIPEHHAFVVHIHDDGRHMLGDETYRPVSNAGFHDWRFGVDGVPHPSTCGRCGRKTDTDYISPTFRVRRRNEDLVATCDGYVLASRRLRDYCVRQALPGVAFASLPADDEFFCLRSNRIVQFDAEARRTRFENFCEDCRGFYNVIGATPTFLKRGAASLSAGFYRTDLEFGSGPEQGPLIIVAEPTGRQLRAGS